MFKVTSQNGINLIKTFEGCRLTAYQDQVGVWTIGYGHTGPDVWEGLTITQEQAEHLLAGDLHRFEVGVQGLVSAPLTQNQFDALVSFSFNLGLNTLKNSTLLKDLNAKSYQVAAQEFVKWDHAGGQVVEGLLRRRQAEQKLFLS